MGKELKEVGGAFSGNKGICRVNSELGMKRKGWKKVGGHRGWQGSVSLDQAATRAVGDVGPGLAA